MASPQATVIMNALDIITKRLVGHDRRHRSYIRHSLGLGMEFLGPLQPRGTRRLRARIPHVGAEWHVTEDCREDVRILYLHGGGYCAGSPRVYRHFTGTLARETGLPVLSVDYRLAPKHPFPAATDDALAAYVWLCQNGPRGKYKAQKIIIAGDSAGGGLSLSTAMTLRNQGRLRDGGLVLISPWLDLTCSSSASARIAGRDVMIHVEVTKMLADYYTGGQDATNPMISPFFGRFDDLPPMFVSIAGREILLDDTMDAIQKAREAGVDVTVERNEEMFHIWPVMSHVIPEGQASVTRMTAWLRHLAR